MNKSLKEVLPKMQLQKNRPHFKSWFLKLYKDNDIDLITMV